MIKNPGNSFTLLSLVYIILLSFVYFCKPRAKNLETKIYNFVVITCLIGTIISIGTYFFMYNLNTYPINNPYLDYYLSSIPKLFIFGHKEFSV